MYETFIKCLKNQYFTIIFAYRRLKLRGIAWKCPHLSDNLSIFITKLNHVHAAARRSNND